MLPGISDHRNRFPVIPDQYSSQGRTPFELKCDPFSDPEVQHLRVRAHLVQKSQALYDPLVQVDKFLFAEFVNINLRHGL
jgi:hypothetical protein